MSERTWKSSNMLLFAILHQELCYVCCCFVVRSFCLEFLLNVCVGSGAHYPGEFGVLKHPP